MNCHLVFDWWMFVQAVLIGTKPMLKLCSQILRLCLWDFICMCFQLIPCYLILPVISLMSSHHARGESFCKPPNFCLYFLTGLHISLTPAHKLATVHDRLSVSVLFRWLLWLWYLVNKHIHREPRLMCRIVFSLSFSQMQPLNSHLVWLVLFML